MKKRLGLIFPALALALSFVLAPPSFAGEQPGTVFVKKGDGGFYIDKYLATQEEYKKIEGVNRSRHRNCPNCPVEQMNLPEAADYCAKLGKALPTQEEYEYAATSGGNNDVYAGTSNPQELDDYVWHKGNSGGKSHPIGEKKPNALGLYDMSGNVWVWINDGKIRGGSWDHDAVNVRENYGGLYDTDGRYTYVGIRCVKY